MQLDLPTDFPRLASAIELGLFRSLQESRYSGASEVDICVAADAEEVSLIVRDNGRGIPAEIIRNFRDHGSGVGIGLSGMRERMTELGGCLELSADDHGTVVCARVPVSLSLRQKSSPQRVSRKLFRVMSTIFETTLASLWARLLFRWARLVRFCRQQQRPKARRAPVLASEI